MLDRKKGSWHWLATNGACWVHNSQCYEHMCFSGAHQAFLWYTAAWWKDTQPTSLFGQLELHQRRTTRKEEAGCHWSEKSCMAVWLDKMKGLISSDNTRQWVVTPNPRTPPLCLHTFHMKLFLKHGLIYCTASAAFDVVCLHCMHSGVPAVCVCLGKHVLGIAANPSTASHWNVSPQGRAVLRYQVEGFHFLSL